MIVASGNGQGIAAVPGFQDSVAVIGQNLPQQLPYTILVFNDEYRLISTYAGLDVIDIGRTGFQTGNEHLDGGTLPRLTGDPDSTTALLHDAIHDGKAQP